MHLKREPAPKTWPIERKQKAWAIRPVPGPHAIEDSIPLGIILRDILKVVQNSFEARRLLSAKKVLVDEKVRTSQNFPVGLMDVITFTETKESYRMLPTKHGLRPKGTSTPNKKLLKIKNIQSTGKNFQLNLHDGGNLIVDKKYNVNDILVFNLKDKKIEDCLKFKEGNYVIITGGAKIGEEGTIEKINITPTPWANTVVVKKDSERYETIFDYVFVVGKERPVF